MLNYSVPMGRVLYPKQRGWKPRRLCSTTSGDLLVSINTYDEEQENVVQYHGSSEKKNYSVKDLGDQSLSD